MTTLPNLMQLDGTSTLDNVPDIVKRFFSRSQSVVPTEKITPSMPKRKGSAIAAVLVELLSGKEVNCIEQADALGSSRVKDHISNLRKRHGWEAIESMPKAIATSDGRVQWIMRYWIPLSVIKLHDSEKTRIWISEVQSIRRSQRAEYKDAEIRACLSNLRKGKQLLDAIDACKVSERGGA